MKPLRNLLVVKRLPKPSSSGLIILPDDQIEQNPYCEILAVNDGSYKPHNFRVGDIVFIRPWSGVQIDDYMSKWDSRAIVPMEMAEATLEEVNG